MFNNTNGLLTIIAIALIGIFTVMIIHYDQKEESPGKKIVNDIGEAVEEIGDEIDDSTSN